MERGGGTPITDATATPSDVVTGKVFYNNDGRQVGTNEAGLKVLSTSVPYEYNPSNTDRYTYVTSIIYDYDGTPKSVDSSTAYHVFSTNKTVALNATKILYFTYSYYPGVIFDIIYGGNYDIFQCTIQHSGEQTLQFSYVNNIVHLNTRKKQCNGAIISIYYI